jgi:hypothetical protein
MILEGNVVSKHQAHFLKGKGNMDSRDRVWFDASTQKIA